jgi:hypothetical protein
MPTLRRALAAWTLLCGVGWLIGWSIWRANERDCRRHDGYLCFTDPEIFRVSGAVGLAVLFAGLILIAVVWKVAQLARR